MANPLFPKIRDTHRDMSSKLALIADIGGTNARFALTDPAAERIGILEQRSLRAAEFASLHHAAEHYLAEVGATPSRATTRSINSSPSGPLSSRRTQGSGR